MADATGLVTKMKKAAIEAQKASRPVNVYFGQVISTSPMRIDVEQKMILGEDQLILTRNVTDRDPLRAGDRVLIIRQQEGQAFAVIDQIGR